MSRPALSAHNSTLNTLLAMAAGSVVMPAVNKLRRGAASPNSLTGGSPTVVSGLVRWANCGLAAAISLRAGSDVMPSWAAVVTGLVAGLSYLLASHFWRRYNLFDLGHQFVSSCVLLF